MDESDQTEQSSQDIPTATMRPYPGTPRWVKVFGIITLIVVVLVGIVLLGGHLGSGHGPRQHLLGGDSGDHIASTNVTDHEGK